MEPQVNLHETYHETCLLNFMLKKIVFDYLFIFTIYIDKQKMIYLSEHFYKEFEIVTIAVFISV